MDIQPKTKPGSPPVFASSGHRNLKDMSISELVSVLRAAFRVDDFDRVEEVLVSRDARLKAEIGPLQEKFELERLMRIHAEEELRKREEQFERGKRPQENYEMLLKEVKKREKRDWVDRDTIRELRKKNFELRCENCELKELKQKWVLDSNDITALRMKNSELEEAVKKNLATIDELRTENCKLADEKRRLEDDIKFLISVGASGGRNTEGEEVKDEENVHDYEFGIEDTGHSLDAGTAQPVMLLTPMKRFEKRKAQRKVHMGPKKCCVYERRGKKGKEQKWES